MPFLPPNQQRQSTEATMTFPRLFINSLTFPQCPCGCNQHISMCDMQNRMSIISACTFHVLRTWISQDKATARSQTSSSLIVLRLLQFGSDPSVGLISVISVSVTPPPVTRTHDKIFTDNDISQTFHLFFDISTVFEKSPTHFRRKSMYKKLLQMLLYFPDFW